MKDKQDVRLRDSAPVDELTQIMMESTLSVEADLALEDEGWAKIGSSAGDVILESERVANLKLSRLYYLKDPLAHQAIRLWTDYSFGPGMTWQTEDEKATKVLESFWDSRDNEAVLSARGQRKSSDRLLVDGEIFFAIFLGANGSAKIRTIESLEITEIITDPDDIEDVRYYRREWSDRQGTAHTTIYRSPRNLKDEATKDASGKAVQKTDDALIYHLTYNTISQRGNPLLLPALDWIKYYRKFLSSRIAIMLALARFAWKTKVKGGQAVVDVIKAKTQDKEIAAGSQLIENLGSDTVPIKSDTGASGAYQDARQIKLQICSAVGWPEQYFGDIATGNLATAKTVELPVTKMCQSYQSVWNDAYQDIDEIVLVHNKTDPSTIHIDRVFPRIAPEDYAEMATSIQQILQVLPEFAGSEDVQQQAMLAIGVNDPKEALDEIANKAKEAPTPSQEALKIARILREVLKEREKSNV